MVSKTQFLLFGGKGGVGKTTCAAATALQLSQQGKKTLLVSTDPAHSLSDSFQIKIGPKEIEISTNLFAVELDPKEQADALQEALKGMAPAMEGTPLGALGGVGGINPAELMGGLTELGTMPGMDEMAALQRFLTYVDSSEYDVVVFDTAPTGHTLNFLKLPETMDSWVGKLITFRSKISGVMDMFKGLMSFGGSEKPEEPVADKLQELKEKIHRGRAVLQDPKRTEFRLVMIPQDMSIAESARALKQLDEFKIPVKTVLVNQVQPEHAGCTFCSTRQKAHTKKLAYIQKNFPKQKVVSIPLFDHEIIGAENLVALEEFL